VKFPGEGTDETQGERDPNIERKQMVLTSVNTRLTSSQTRETRLVRIRRERGEVIQGCDIYIGRACHRGGWELPKSPFCNPFSLKGRTRNEVLLLYLQYLYSSGLVREILQFEGKVLGCWCLPERCHGEVLLAILALCATEGGIIVIPSVRDVIYAMGIETTSL